MTSGWGSGTNSGWGSGTNSGWGSGMGSGWGSGSGGPSWSSANADGASGRCLMDATIQNQNEDCAKALAQADEKEEEVNEVLVQYYCAAYTGACLPSEGADLISCVKKAATDASDRDCLKSVDGFGNEGADEDAKTVEEVSINWAYGMSKKDGQLVVASP